MQTLSSESDVRALLGDRPEQTRTYQVADDFSGRIPLDADCPRYGRHTTFLDFVKTAIADGAHDRERLADILTGTAGTWLTVCGRDGGRAVRCARCDQSLRMPGAYSEYSSSSYAYA